MENLYIEKNIVFLTNFLKKSALKKRYIKLVDQAEHFSTYWPRLRTLTNSWIDWTMDKYDLERFICAFDNSFI